MDYPGQGYAEARFTSDIDDDLLCAICLNVLREPLQCVKNEHHFCAPCIKRHLNNTAKCPSCMEDLSVGTLRKPARYLTKHLSSLQIKCDYEGRGCCEFVKLEQLQYHLEGCGYKPVPCDGCGQMVNRGDMLRHETKTCPVKAKCHDCTSIKQDVGELKETVSNVQKELQSVNKNEESLKKEIVELKETINNVQTELQVNEESLKNEIGELKKELQSVNKNEQLLKNEIGELKVAFHNLGETVSKIKGSLDMITENQATGINVKAVEEPQLEEAIVVIGGYNHVNKYLNSAEMYVWSKQKWVPFPSTKHSRCDSSAVVHQNQILVTGGEISNNTLTNSIEAINVADGKPGEWYEAPYTLPFPAFKHCCISSKDCLVLIGGCKGNRYNVSDGIYTMTPNLQSQHSPKWVCSSQMPTTRCFHGVELFDNKIVIIGGAEHYVLSSSNESVLSFDLETNTLCEISKLCSGIVNMATVPWGDHIVLLGGRNDLCEIFNTAKMYNIKTGKMYLLPPMKYKRCFCTAVVLNNSIVVMGGFCEGQPTNIVECFNFATYEWSELPPMTESRSGATAVVVPIKASQFL